MSEQPGHVSSSLTQAQRAGHRLAASLESGPAALLPSMLPRRQLLGCVAASAPKQPESGWLTEGNEGKRHRGEPVQPLRIDELVALACHLITEQMASVVVKSQGAATCLDRSSIFLQLRSPLGPPAAAKCTPARSDERKTQVDPPHDHRQAPPHAPPSLLHPCIQPAGVLLPVATIFGLRDVKFRVLTAGIQWRPHCPRSRCCCSPRQLQRQKS